MGLTVFGAYLIAKHAIRYILERQRRNEMQRRYTSLVILLFNVGKTKITLKLESFLTRKIVLQYYYEQEFSYQLSVEVYPK